MFAPMPIIIIPTVHIWILTSNSEKFGVSFNSLRKPNAGTETGVCDAGSKGCANLLKLQKRENDLL